jgi:Flp pilus assembly pilin Flp
MDKLRAMTATVVMRADRTWRKLRSWRLPTRRTDHGGAEHGQGLAEYALILAGIAIVAIVSMIFLGTTITELFWNPINEQFDNVLTFLGI